MWSKSISIITSTVLIEAITTAFFLTLVLTYAAGIKAEGLRFTAIPSTHDKSDLLPYQMAAKHLSKALKIPVTFVPSGTYEQSLTLFTSSKVQLAWLGGLTGVMAREGVPGALAIAEGFEDQYFKTYFIAKKSLGLPDNGSMPQANPKQYSMLLGPKLSTSGRLMPEYFIRKYYGRSSEEVFAPVNFSMSHKDTIERVVKGEYDIGAVNYREWFSYIQMKSKGSSSLMVVGKTPHYNDYHWVSRPDIKAVTGVSVKQVQKAILSMNRERDLLRAFNRSHFIRAENKEFSIILEICNHLGINVKARNGQ